MKDEKKYELEEVGLRAQFHGCVGMVYRNSERQAIALVVFLLIWLFVFDAWPLP